MLVGVPKEIKVHESRVALTPEGAIEEDPALDRGLNVHAGKIRYNAVAVAHGYSV